MIVARIVEIMFSNRSTVVNSVRVSALYVKLISICVCSFKLKLSIEKIIFEVNFNLEPNLYSKVY